MEPEAFAFAKLIAEVGMGVVMAGVVVFLLIYLVKVVMPRMEEAARKAMADIETRHREERKEDLANFMAATTDQRKQSADTLNDVRGTFREINAEQRKAFLEALTSYTTDTKGSLTELGRRLDVIEEAQDKVCQYRGRPRTQVQ